MTGKDFVSGNFTIASFVHERNKKQFISNMKNILII